MGWFRFGEFELDLDAFVLKRADEVLPIQPKVFDVLRYLVENRGRMVTKTELLDDLWRDEVVNEGAIAWSVSHIRRALGQQRGDKQPIETVHGRGYRFTAQVEYGEPRPSAARSVPPPPVSRPAPPSTGLVGRTRVMSELRQRLQDAGEGRGALCVLTGEAGIGKTRCAKELTLAAQSLGMQTIAGRCPQEVATPPLWPVASALARTGGEHPQVAARARELMSGAGDPDADTDTDATASTQSINEARFRMIEEFAQLLREVAAARPTLLIVDDIHWADASTLRLLGFLAPELRELPLCIVCTLREGEREPGSARDQPLQLLLRYSRSIPLGALDVEQVAELVEIIGRQRPSDELAQAVRRASGGVPLFIEEVVRSLVLEHGEQAIRTLGPDAVQLPELARDLLRERLNRLPRPTVEVLSTACVIGDVFDLSLLSALLELEPETLLERLEPALVEGQLQSDAPHAYRFVHSLFQSVLYDDLSAAERVATHRKIALLLGRRDHEQRHGEIARHYYLSLPAGDHLTVMRYAKAAGDAARTLFAFEDAAMHYTWALEAQVFGGNADPRVRAELLLALATTHRFAGRIIDATETTTRLLELAQQHRMDDLVVRATRLRRPTVAMSMLPDALARRALEGVLEHLPGEASVTLVSALSQLACIPPYAGDLARSKELSSRAVALARKLPRVESLFEAMRARLFSLSGPDDIDELLEVSGRMLALHAEAPAVWHIGDALGARLLAHTLAGDITKADAALEQMRAGIGERHWPESWFYCERLAAQRRFLDGAFEEADERWKGLRKQATRAGVAYANAFYGFQAVFLLLEREGPQAVMARQPYGAPGTTSILVTPSLRGEWARIAAEAGELEFARTQLSALGDPAEHPRDGHYMYLLANIAVAATILDDKPRCEQLYSLLAPYPQLNTPSPMGYYLGSVAHFLGLLARALGRPAQADEHFGLALERNEVMRYRPGVVRTLLARGSLAADGGKAAAARELFKRAHDEAAALGMAAARQNAEAALARL